jgi:hypothetical protein
LHDNPFDYNTPISIEHPDLTIPLHISGTNIFLDTRTPTQLELDTCPHIHLTSEAEWNPQTVHLASSQSVEAEVSNIHNTGYNELEPVFSLKFPVFIVSQRWQKVCMTYMTQKRSISATMTDLPGHRTFISKEWHSSVTPEQLSEQWNIGLAQSKQTL